MYYDSKYNICPLSMGSEQHPYRTCSRNSDLHSSECRFCPFEDLNRLANSALNISNALSMLIRRAPGYTDLGNDWLRVIDIDPHDFR